MTEVAECAWRVATRSRSVLAPRGTGRGQLRRTSRRTTLALNLLCASLLGSGLLATLQPSFAFAAGNQKARAPLPAKPPAAKAQINASYGRLPLSFEPNRGQADRAVDFVARGAGYTVYLSRGSAVLTLT